MTNLGQFGRYLGINFIFTKEGLFMSQKPYIEDMLYMFGMVHCSSTKVFVVEGIRLIIDMNEHKMDVATLALCSQVK